MHSPFLQRAIGAFVADLIRQREEGSPGPYCGPIENDRDARDYLIDGRIDLVAAMSAAVASMRDPGIDVKLAGINAAYDPGRHTIAKWQAMIDAALKESPDAPE